MHDVCTVVRTYTSSTVFALQCQDKKYKQFYVTTVIYLLLGTRGGVVAGWLIYKAVSEGGRLLTHP